MKHCYLVNSRGIEGVRDRDLMQLRSKSSRVFRPHTVQAEQHIKESGVSEFVEPNEKQRHAALHGLTDASLVGPYWRLDDLDGLTDDERRRLKKYRHETFGFEEYCEGLVARSERRPEDVANLTAVLDRWEAAFCGLRFWHQDRSILGCERNPVDKVLIYEESRITGVRGRLGPRGVVADHRPGVPAAARVTPTRARARSKAAGPVVNGGTGGTDLTDAVLLLADAINRLADVISRKPGSRTARAPRSEGAARLGSQAPHAAP